MGDRFRRRHLRRRAAASHYTDEDQAIFAKWERHVTSAPAPGKIRILAHPRTAKSTHVRIWWETDMSLTEWIQNIDTLESDAHAGSPPLFVRQTDAYVAELRNLLFTVQRQRFLARKVIQRLRHRVWSIKPQCNVDLIDLEPVSDRDAVLLMDTTNHHLYRFHRRDVFNALLARIGYSDEMLPSPRQPTNPYTNAPLTLAQTIAVCQQLIADYARRGRCPPPLFAAFCHSGYDMKRLYTENASMLAEHAIRMYFKEIHPHNISTIYETVVDLLNNAGESYTSVALRRWIRQEPHTPLHAEWLSFVRDYTLYMNLHVQTRPHWYSEEYVYADVRELWERTVLPDPASSRIRTLRTAAAPVDLNAIAAQLFQPVQPSPALQMMGALNMGLPLFLQPPALPVTLDVSGNMTLDAALQALQNSLFRL